MRMHGPMGTVGAKILLWSFAYKKTRAALRLGLELLGVAEGDCMYLGKMKYLFS